MGDSKDPILEEFKFCETCEPKVLELVEYVRNLESAQVVAKEALETISLANTKLTVEQKILQKRIAELEDWVRGKTVGELKKKMDAIGAAHQRLINRDRLI